MNASYTSIPCWFCNERFPSGKFLREHLMICENKMDWCPRCRQYVRRSIFDYHYNNNCRYDDTTIHNTSLSESITVDISTSLMTINNGTHSQQPRARSLTRQINSICQYCGQYYHQEDSITHQEYCLMNPKNFAKISRYNTRSSPIAPHTIRSYSIPSLDRLNNSHKITYIYCKYCHIFFESSRFYDHEKACENIYQQFQEELWRRRQKTSDLFRRCAHCGVLFTKNGLKIHQISCKRSRPYYIIPQNHDHFVRSSNLW